VCFWRREGLAEAVEGSARECAILWGHHGDQLQARPDHLRQIALRHLPLARVAVALHPHRVYYVFPASIRPHVLVLPSRQRSWRIAAAVLGALMVLAVLSWLIA
jgi:hypothetical protein